MHDRAVRLTMWSDISGPAFRPPPLIVKEDGAVLEFHDYHTMYDMQVGDVIEYQSTIGHARFVVSSVVPAGLPDFPPELNLVTARREA